MSDIDCYRHRLVGVALCPSSYDIVLGRPSTKHVPIYILDEDSEEFCAKSGDLIIGGGSGSSAAMRIGMPEALLHYIGGSEDWVWDDMHKCFWSPSNSLVVSQIS
jgi:hypothetical protein